MSKTLTALFDSEAHAARVVGELRASGVRSQQIAVVPAIGAQLGTAGEKARMSTLKAGALFAGILMLVSTLIAVFALDLGAREALAAALIGALLGGIAGTLAAEIPIASAPRGSVFVAVRTADSKLAARARKIFAREAIDYAFHGTTVARDRPLTPGRLGPASF